MYEVHGNGTEPWTRQWLILEVQEDDLVRVGHLLKVCVSVLSDGGDRGRLWDCGGSS